MCATAPLEFKMRIHVYVMHNSGDKSTTTFSPYIRITEKINCEFQIRIHLELINLVIKFSNTPSLCVIHPIGGVKKKLL